MHSNVYELPSHIPMYPFLLDVVSLSVSIWIPSYWTWSLYLTAIISLPTGRGLSICQYLYPFLLNVVSLSDCNYIPSFWMWSLYLPVFVSLPTGCGLSICQYLYSFLLDVISLSASICIPSYWTWSLYLPVFESLPTGRGLSGALTLRPRTIRPPVQFIFGLGGPIDPQRAV
jgi:hypothetical protein